MLCRTPPARRGYLPELLYYYDSEVVRMIVEKYDFLPMDAFRAFVASTTYAMLRDPGMWLYEFGPAGVFDIWEAERVVGDPHASAYLRREGEDS